MCSCVHEHEFMCVSEWGLCVRVFLCVCMLGVEGGGGANKHHDPSHLETANWQLISRIDSVVRSQVPAPLLAPPAR